MKKFLVLALALILAAFLAGGAMAAPTKADGFVEGVITSASNDVPVSVDANTEIVGIGPLKSGPYGIDGMLSGDALKDMGDAVIWGGFNAYAPPDSGTVSKAVKTAEVPINKSDGLPANPGAWIAKQVGTDPYSFDKVVQASSVVITPNKSIKLTFKDKYTFESSSDNPANYWVYIVGGSTPPPTPDDVVITTQASLSGVINTQFTQKLAVSGDIAVVWSADKLPAWLALSGDTLLGIPTSVNKYTFKIIASGDKDLDSKDITLSVTEKKSSGSSGGGCNAGLGCLLALLAVPFIKRHKK